MHDDLYSQICNVSFWDLIDSVWLQDVKRNTLKWKGFEKNDRGREMRNKRLQENMIALEDQEYATKYFKS